MADFQLPVGAQTQTVNVEGQVSQVETQSTAVGALVEGKQIRELPLNGRNFTQLLTLAPGVTQIPLGAPGAGSTFYGNGQKYSIAGSRPSGQAYLLDDQDMVNFWNNGPGRGRLGNGAGRRCHRGVPDPDQHLQRAVRRQRRRDQCVQPVGHQRVPRLRIRVSAQRQARSAQLLRWRQSLRRSAGTSSAAASAAPSRKTRSSSLRTMKATGRRRS